MDEIKEILTDFITNLKLEGVDKFQLLQAMLEVTEDLDQEIEDENDEEDEDYFGDDEL